MYNHYFLLVLILLTLQVLNGIYNQDFNENVILIEIGGYESTTTEVLNSSLAFAKCFMEAINE